LGILIALEKEKEKKREVSLTNNEGLTTISIERNGKKR